MQDDVCDKTTKGKFSMAAKGNSNTKIHHGSSIMAPILSAHCLHIHAYIYFELL